jgi:ubiquinone/menaquinone biosynthesis C-methylase UbiE
MPGKALLDVSKFLHLTSPASGAFVAQFGPDRHGHLIFPLARHVGGEGRVYAVDLVPAVLEMIESDRAHHAYVNVTCLRGNFEREGGVQLEDGKLDAIFLIHTLWKISDHQGMLKEAQRLLKPTGKLVLVDWHPKTDHPVAPPAECRVEPTHAEAFLRRGGFVKERDLQLPRVHWGTIFARSR